MQFVYISGSSECRTCLVEMICLRSMASEQRNIDNCQIINRCVCVVRPRRVNMDNRRLIGTEMKGCYVRDWIVGERDKEFHEFYT